MKILAKSVRKILFKIPFYQSLYISEDIEKLEEDGKLEEARKLRGKWLHNIPLKYSGPLWCSEGEDLLHQRKKYAEALVAFEKAMQSKFTPALNPLRIFTGASVAAVMTTNLEKAKQYYSEAQDWYQKLKSGKKLDSYLSHFDETFIWLSENINKNQ